MIHVVTHENRELYRAQLTEMHTLRKRHFIEERGWSGLIERNGGEHDLYDDERTLYFLALDDEGRIGVSMRARPTDDRSMLADIFPHLIGADAAPVNASGVWEISRIFAIRRFRTRSGLRRRSELFLTTVEAAASRGVTRLVGMTDVYLLPQTLGAGWSVRLLGPPASYGEGDVVAVEVDSSPEGLTAFQDRLAIHEPRALHVPMSSPLAQLRPEEAEAFVELFAKRGRKGLDLVKTVVDRVLEAQEAHSDEAIEAMIEKVRAMDASGAASATH